MNPQTFFAHFERLTDAPNAVARLRELILQLAVQGNLIEQDSTDEPSARLLERIETERRRLVKEKKIRGAKPLPFVSEDEKPFEIPSTWQWVRLGEIGDWGAGATPDRKNPDYYGGSTFWFKSGELNDGYISESEETITNLALQKCSLRLNQPGDVLIAMYGATIGKVAILEKTATTNQAVCACTCFASVYNRFLFLLLKAYKTRFTNQGAGGAQPNISREKIIHTVAPLPPFEEQKRIVAKVDELMRLCDELERVQAERREARQRLNRATLDGLLAARDVAEFQARWQTITDNFPTLTAAPDQIGKLRQTVLQLAVQGKLTRQDPQDEPAPALLQRIRAERERLIKEKKLKRADPLPPVSPDETPFALPSGWTWVRLGDFGGFWGGGTPSKSNSEFWQGSIPWVSPKDMKRLYLSDSIDHITDEAVKQSTAQLIPQNSLLLVVRGMILAHSFPVALTLRDVTINQDMKALQLVNPDTAEFLLLACRGLKDEMLKKVVRSSHGTCRLESEDVERFSIPLPPLEEQKRIVSAVNRLMALCDEMEAGLRRAEEDGERLLRAAVRSLLSPAPENSIRVPALA